MRFFLIDKITRWDVGARAEALKNVSLSEDFFDDHFPRHPILPGVLILEGLAQLSGLLLEATLEAKFKVSAKAVLTILERTKFRRMVRPGDTLVYQSEIVTIQETGGKSKARALRDGELVTATDMVFTFQEVDDPDLDRKKRSLMKMWLRGGES